MIARTALISLLLLCFAAQSQEVSLPADLRQHALTQYNSSLFNPTFSLDRNNPQSVSLWTRWQWQKVDTDPTTLFLNYTRAIDEKSTFGVAFFQHNTGIFFNTGGVVNYAYELKLNPIIKLAVGANLFGFNQQLADDRFLPDPDILPVPTQITDDFILQLAPGFNLSVENFSLSMASENLFDYNFKDKGSNTETSDKIFMGMASYDFPVMASDSTAFLRPSIYLRTIPEQDNQIGMNALFSTQKYWGQAGYNNFYGISVGGGGTVLNRFSLGILLEFGTSASLNSKDSSFEIVASYFLGNPQNRRKPIVNVFDALDEDVVLLDEEAKVAKMQEELDNKTDEPEITEEEPSLEEESPEVVDPPLVDKKEARKLAAEERALAKEHRRDSIATAKKEREALAITEEAEAAKKDEMATEKAKQEEAIAVAAAEELKKAEALAAAEKIKAQRAQDSVAKAKVAGALADQKEAEAAIAAAEKLKAQRAQDSITKAEEELAKQKETQEALAAAQKLDAQRTQDSIAEAKAAEELDVEEQAEEVQEQEEKKVTPEAGEKYEEATTEDGVEPGFYLIANVFGTKKYFEAFMKDLTDKGLQPGSFLRSKNNYNYAYLKRYNTIGEARRARDSKFDGKYQGKTWIYRVVSEK